MRANIVQIVSRYYNQNNNMAYSEVRENLRISCSYLRENEDLIMARVDKGGCDVSIRKNTPRR